MPRGREGQYALLDTESLLGYVNAKHVLHATMVSKSELLRQYGCELLYPYPAVVGLYSALGDIRSVKVRKSVNDVVDRIARGPFFEIPTALDVVKGADLANLALARGFEFSALDAMILAMAMRTNYYLQTFNDSLIRFAWSFEVMILAGANGVPDRWEGLTM